jgi:hypothetical protein
MTWRNLSAASGLVTQPRSIQGFASTSNTSGIPQRHSAACRQRSASNETSTRGPLYNLRAIGPPLAMANAAGVRTGYPRHSTQKRPA